MFLYVPSFLTNIIHLNFQQNLTIELIYDFDVHDWDINILKG